MMRTQTSQKKHTCMVVEYKRVEGFPRQVRIGYEISTKTLSRGKGRKGREAILNWSVLPRKGEERETGRERVTGRERETGKER